MVTKEDITNFIKSIEGKPSINPVNVINLLSNIKNNYSKIVRSVNELRVGDIISATNSSGIAHPSIIIKIEGDGVLVLAITHNPPSIHYVVCPKDRLLDNERESYITLCPIFVAYDIAVVNFIGVFENRKELKNIIKCCNRYLRGLKLLDY